MSKISQNIFFAGLILFLLQLVSFFSLKNNLAVTNDRLALGLPVGNTIAIFLSVCFIVILLILAIHKKLFSLSVCLLIAAAISNLFERVVYGGAVDYIKLYLFSINLADLLIIGGLVFIAYTQFAESA